LNLQVELEPSAEDWGELIMDPGYTHGHLTLFRQFIHLYWLMKCIVAKAMSTTTNTMTQSEAKLGLRDIQNELQFNQLQLQNQNTHLSCIERHIPCLPQSKLLGSSVKYLALLESSND